MILPGFRDPKLVELARVLTREDERNFKRGSDLELAQGERIILRSPDGSRWALTVNNSGVLGTTAL